MLVKVKLEKLIKLLPAKLDVESKAVGAVHKREEAQDEASTALETKLQSALGGATVGPTQQLIQQDTSYATNHHAEMLADIQAGRKVTDKPAVEPEAQQPFSSPPAPMAAEFISRPGMALPSRRHSPNARQLLLRAFQ